MPKPLLIAGSWVPSRSARTREIRNPATLELIDVVSDADASDVDAAVQAAREAQHAWWKTPGVEKAKLLHEVATKIRQRERALSTLMCRETGKPLIEAVDCIDWVAACFDYYAEVGRRSWGNSMPPVLPHQVNFTIKEPYGVVAAIVPFNFPLLLMAWKVAPALMAGNTLVCKPPHQNPLCNLLMAECYDGLPPGVVNVVTGASDTGRLLVEHPGVDLVAFTGSVSVGRSIAATAGAHLKKVNLELGSVDPLIVFADADLDAAVPGTAWARLLNAGQVCTSAKRIYVEQSIAPEFTQRLIDYVSELSVGDPMDPTVDIGPMISAKRSPPSSARSPRPCDKAPDSRSAASAVVPVGCPDTFSSPLFSPTCPMVRSRRPKRSSARCSRSPRCAMRTKPSPTPTILATDSAPASSPPIWRPR
jgi:acyl-CoA reductase-like NAD-dependent aldehyde dehydrogenase